ncbi:tetratricopeptide repeat protein [Nonomuraea wenchangensis]|uniref:tetratricopeptide repeat protein n=1 Tax=Nonomuraea wenchangensis TaxID=568860 RepID=UPI00371F964B
MTSGRWQEHRLLLAVILLAAAGAVSGVLISFKVTHPWVIGGAAVAVAVVTVLSGLIQERYKRTVARREEVAFKLQDGTLVLPSGLLPKVSDLKDPVRLGVHPSISLPGSPTAEPPAYVPRDVDEEVRKRLASGGFVLLVGDSTAGKSRTAYEAVRATLPDHVLIAPHDRNALLAAIESCVRLKRSVLWLSDLEHYIGHGGLTREHVGRILGEGGHRVIVATLRAAERARLTSTPASPDSAVRAAGREIQEALEQAHPIYLLRMFSVAELERAQARNWDSRISSALKRADQYGIAEYLASGPELQRLLEDAWDIGVNPRGAALVAAAIDCRRAGYTSSLARPLLNDLHTAYLEEKGGQRLHPESLEEAWSWATRSRRATTALLSPVPDAGDGSVAVFDYLVDLKQQADGPLAQVSDVVIRAVLAHVHNPDDADQVAATAYRQGRYQLAEQARRTALNLHNQIRGHDAPSTLICRSNLALVLNALGRLEESEAEYRAVLKIQRRVIGEEHPSTLTSRFGLATLLRDLGRADEAEAEHRAVLEIERRVLGEEHPSTLDTRNQLAGVLHDLGRLAEAEAEHRAVLKIERRVLGEEHPSTLDTRNNLGGVLTTLGRLDEAEAEHREVLEIRRRLLGEEHPETLLSRGNWASVLFALGRLPEAEAEDREVLEIRRRVLGEEHPSTLSSRFGLVNLMHVRGGLSDAEVEAEYRTILDIGRRVMGERHTSTPTSDHGLASILRDLTRLIEPTAVRSADED